MTEQKIEHLAKWHCTSMHFKNALNAPIYAVSRAFFTQFLAKFRFQDNI